MTFEILVHELAREELRQLRRFDQQRIVDAMEQQLVHEPAVSTRNRKCLVGLIPTFEHMQPVWELRVGDFRVFYDVDEEASQVHVRAIRSKQPDQETETIT